MGVAGRALQARHGANRYLPAVKGVLREAWRLGEYSGEELEKVWDVRSVPGSARRLQVEL
jgi:hypothetical protein